MSQKLPNRYPGSKPFEKEQSGIFFGRDEDIESLYQTVNVNTLTILHGKSGLGKTSLLNAGVVPRFTDRDGYLAFFPRLHAYDGENYTDPTDEIRRQLLPAIGPSELFFSDIANDKKNASLWQINKTLEWVGHSKSGILLVFDQFEELFSYPTAKVEEFAKQFAELVYNRMPDAFQRQIYAQLGQGFEFARQHQDELALIESPPPLKIVVGIRSDRLSFVDSLKKYLPGALKSGGTYELKPLSRTQAEKAIVEPAAKDGNFASAPFTYHPDLLDEILDYLTDRGEEPVESTVLQVICRFAESKVTRAGQQLTLADLGGNIPKIYENHYQDILETFAPPERLNVRRMVEEGMIFEEDERRLTLYEGAIEKQFGVSKETLEKLVREHHLLRAESMSSGGATYEISHDSLVKPILSAYKERREKERLEKAEEEKMVAYKAELERERKRRRILLQYGGAAVITLATIILFFALKKEQSRKAELEQINKELSGSRDSINVLLDSKNQLLQSLQNAKDSLELATYDYHRKRAMDLFAQREYADASESFRQAINYITKDRQQDLPELRNYLVQSHSLQALRAKFDTLMNEGDRFREEFKWKDAYVKYNEAKKLNYDNDAVKVKLLLCRRELEQEASLHLRRALTFLTKGNDPGLAKATITEYVDPIRDLLIFWDASIEREYEIVTAKLKTKK
jgi:hypothetical protein